jgi:putative ABC transport system permease protein
MSGLLQDVRYALRQLRKNPGFTFVAALILSLGIGGVTAMFSTSYAVLLRPLPYYKPDRLVLGRGTWQGNINPWLSGPDYVDYRDKSRSFSALEAFFVAPREVTATTGRTAERVKAWRTSAGLFGALGVNMELGRAFTKDEGWNGGPPVAIVSHNYWQKHFAREGGVAQHSIAIDGEICDVIGVTPAGFEFIQRADIWLPMRPQDLGPRRFNNWFILGRLKDGVKLAQAQSEVDVIAAQLEKAYPDTNAKKGLLLTLLQSTFTEQYRSSLGLLCAGAGAILLIAWANAAGLLLARGAVRRGELAVRAVMGASYWRLMRLLLAEALILAGAAGAMGAAIAVWAQNGLLRLMPLETLFLGGIGISWPALLIILAATLLTWFGFGLIPAWQTRNVNLAQGMRSSGRGSVGRGARLRSGLVAGQVALSIALLVLAGLLLRSLDSLHRANPGFNAHNLLTVEIPLPAARYSEVRRSAFFAALLDGVRSLPGVTSAAAISQLPLRDPFNDISIYAADDPPTDPTKMGDAYQRVVMPGYFQTMGIPIVAGRDIQLMDTANSRRVVVISQQLARMLFPKRNPLGQMVVIDRANDTPWEIVGVVGDVKQSRLREDASLRGTFYRAHAQQAWPAMRLAIRTGGNPLAIVRGVRELLQKMDPDVPLSGPRTMEEVIANGAISETAQAACLAAFSALALILAAVGIYGLLAYVVTQRTGEFGIRLALGAQRATVVRSVLGDGLKTTLIGAAAGLGAAVLAAPLLATQLYGVHPLDLATFITVTLLMIAVSIAACWIPARRASKVDPMVALRYE